MTLISKAESELRDRLEARLRGAKQHYFYDADAAATFLIDLGFRRVLWFAYWENAALGWVARVDPVLRHGYTRSITMRIRR